MDEIRLFDLNIEKILEAWDNTHSVRELISNALDEQVLTGTPDIIIEKAGDGTWIIRDFGRGLRYEHFTQNENPEKLKKLKSWCTRKKLKFYPISAVTGEGVEKLKFAMAKEVEQLREASRSEAALPRA